MNIFNTVKVVNLMMRKIMKIKSEQVMCWYRVWCSHFLAECWRTKNAGFWGNVSCCERKRGVGNEALWWVEWWSNRHRHRHKALYSVQYFLTWPWCTHATPETRREKQEVQKSNVTFSKFAASLRDLTLCVKNSKWS